jgi:hypothetical protein
MRLTMITLMVFAVTAAFGQEQVPAEKKSLSQLQNEWREQDNKKAVQRLAQIRTQTEEWLGKYNDQITTRIALAEKLARALKDGDETLIEVAVADLTGNKHDLARSAKWVVQEEGEQLMKSASDAYRSKLIKEDEYAEHLKFYRQAKARTEEPVPADLAELIAKAKEKIPDYFAMLKTVWGNDSI